MTISDKFRKTIREYNLVSKGDSIIIGVSGGPDSLALLYLLHSLSKELNLKLYIAHFDHMLRPDSKKDAEFVMALADKLKIPLFLGNARAIKLKKEGSLEESARNARFAFLFSSAKKVRAKKIALGHNLDDQAETVLMRILRGAGLYGLASILPKRKFFNFEIIRPLIEIRRKDIERYLKRKKIVARIDVSNLEDTYFRNRLRHKLLPLLEKEYNKNIKQVLANIAQSCGSDYDYLNGVALRSMKECKHKFNLARFAKLHPALKRLLMRRSINSLQGDTRRITFRHIREIEDLILSRPTGSVVDLPKGISVKKDKRNLVFYRK